MASALGAAFGAAGAAGAAGFTACRTYRYALTTHAAFRVINVGHVVGDSYRSERTLLLALTTTDAGVATSLAGYGTLVFVDTRDKDSTRLRSLLAQLDDALRTCLHAGTARGTFLLIHLGDTGLRVDADRTEVAGLHAIPIA